ncbi:MAG: VCBS repeat-containing protein [Planctomycetota bacterium]
MTQKTRALVEYSVILVLAVMLAGVLLRGKQPEARGKPDQTVSAPAVEKPKEVPLLPMPDLGFKPVKGLPEKGSWRCQVQCADLNGDKLPDLVACNREEDGLNVFLRQADGSYLTSNDGIPRDLSYGGIALADMDKDGDVDIVFSTHKAPMRVYLNDGKAHWTEKTDGLTNKQLIVDVCVGDLNEDGNLDIACMPNFEGGISLFYGKGNVGFEEAEPKSIEAVKKAGKFGTIIRMADIDQDGHLDLIALLNTGLKVFFNDGHGNFTLKDKGLPTPTIGGSLFGCEVANIDGKGPLEVGVVGVRDPNFEKDPLNRGIFLFHWDQEKQAWDQLGKGLDATESMHGIAFTDINGDQKLDLVTTGTRRAVAFWLGDGQGSFTEAGRIDSATKKARLTIADVLGNGKVGVALSYYGGIAAYVRD